MGRLQSISIEDKITFDWSVHVLNECFGKDYKRWMRAWIQLTDSEAVWFPKLAVIENGQEVAQDKVYGCINILSEDGCEITEMHSGGCGKRDQYLRYVFAKTGPREPYKYIGTFVRDLEKCTPDKAVHKRVATSVDLSRW